MNALAHFPEGTRAHDTRLPSGLRMRWYEYGETRRDAPCVLFLHGFPELAVSWRHQFAQLGEDYRVVAPDMRGFGQTDAPRRVRDYRLDALCTDVSQLMDVLGEPRVHLVGHDWGGAVAWEFAQRSPHRLRSLSVLNCPPVQFMLRAIVRPAQVRMSWYIFFFQLPYLSERFFSRDPNKFVRSVFRGTAANKGAFPSDLLSVYADTIRQRGLPAVRYYRAALRHPCVRLRAVDVPTLLIWGLRDKALGPWFAEPERYRTFVRDFELVAIDDAGHWVQQEAPDAVGAALRLHFADS